LARENTDKQIKQEGKADAWRAFTAASPRIRCTLWFILLLFSAYVLHERPCRPSASPKYWTLFAKRETFLVTAGNMHLNGCTLTKVFGNQSTLWDELQCYHTLPFCFRHINDPAKCHRFRASMQCNPTYGLQDKFSSLCAVRSLVMVLCVPNYRSCGVLTACIAPFDGQVEFEVALDFRQLPTLQPLILAFLLTLT
jgi:hypothetical protein